mmetsp:Transcript_15724/g.38277  ORF Transcript_15724/g.38277 Transcript_15724/m.38277 type:complete len:102 (+) Transcript_15724:129-434(+)|eukprot:CAMPEP_0206233780 /NCGR_PEP_ID=MMETSP0047_2-20121206/12206_1 /ASSEMBLY_ACC=CAM_ASM_000192 /TAXON_ID=195065 /ORGANISM="Chroomonas mesostigmatica_cf, Strain CCMP1168" /LENGTH=101 /DNA_ID=CAMNT_0053657755 /DNA_START=113 /DNA_END=418 /DNA_ORIENTATION=-
MEATLKFTSQAIDTILWNGVLGLEPPAVQSPAKTIEPADALVIIPILIMALAAFALFIRKIPVSEGKDEMGSPTNWVYTPNCKAVDAEDEAFSLGGRRIMF